MTLPSERTRAVLNTRQFLLRLAHPYGNGIKGISRRVREEARRLLRHYPGWYDFMPDGHFDKQEAMRWGRTYEDRADSVGIGEAAGENHSGREGAAS